MAQHSTCRHILRILIPTLWSATLLQQCSDITRGRQDAKDQNLVVGGNAIDGDVSSDRKTPQAWTQVGVARGRDGDAVRGEGNGRRWNRSAGPRSRCCRFPSRCRAKSRRGHPPPRVRGGDSSGRGRLRGCDASSPALFHLVGELPHALLRDRPARAVHERRFRRVHRSEYIRARPLAPLPKRQGFLDGVGLALQPSAFDRLSGESLLVGGQPNIHEKTVSRTRSSEQGKLIPKIDGKHF
jgi:hypothetical protein